MKSFEFETKENSSERWMVSYSDFITILFVLFVALYAQSTLNNSMSQKDTLVAEIATFEQKDSFIEKIKMYSSKKGIVVNQTNKELKLEIPEKVLFTSGSADLPSSVDLSTLVEMLASHKGIIEITGHTDSIPISTRQFPSNWELSSARASALARYFESKGISKKNLRAVGVADSEPISNIAEKNRRVTVSLKM